MKLRSIILGLGFALTMTSAFAVQPTTTGMFPPAMYPNGIQGGLTAQDIPRVNSLPTAQYLRHQRQRNALYALGRDAAALQQQDGGTLTPEHRAMLQAKLDRINAVQSSASN